MRLHLACAPDGTPRAATLAGADRPEREVGLALLERTLRGGEAVVCDKGYAGREFALSVEEMDAAVLRPPRRDEPEGGLRLSFIRQRIESASGPARTCSPSSATARARSRTCACGSRQGCSAWPPASRSTTSSVARAAPLSPTWREGVESTI
ncbi:MAG: transposase, partial [Actinomycetota bacterium]|nr:transposase [Actinomycetota bacterium]